MFGTTPGSSAQNSATAAGARASGEFWSTSSKDSSLEARGRVAVAEFCRENPGVEPNIVVDHFQGTEFQRLLESGQAALLDTKLEPEQIEVDFRKALVLLQDRRRHQRFEALRLKQDRSPEEETEMLRLLRERNQVPASPSNNAIISGSRSTP